MSSSLAAESSESASIQLWMEVTRKSVFFLMASSSGARTSSSHDKGPILSSGFATDGTDSKTWVCHRAAERTLTQGAQSRQLSAWFPFQSHEKVPSRKNMPLLWRAHRSGLERAKTMIKVLYLGVPSFSFWNHRELRRCKCAKECQVCLQSQRRANSRKWMKTQKPFGSLRIDYCGWTKSCI